MYAFPFALISYADLVVIILTALAVLLAALAVGIGIVAVWGMGSIKEEARRVAKESVLDIVSAESIEAKAKESAARVASKYMETINSGVLLSMSQSELPREASNQVGTVSKPYPGQEKSNDDPNGEIDAGTDHPTAPREGSS